MASRGQGVFDFLSQGVFDFLSGGIRYIYPFLSQNIPYVIVSGAVSEKRGIFSTELRSSTELESPPLLA